MEREPTDRRSDYVRIADDLRQKIISGELALGQSLPSQSEIREIYGTSQATAQKAIAVLRDEGYAVTVHGKGAFVIATHPAETEDPTLRTLREVQARIKAMEAEIIKLQKKVDAL